MAKNQKAGGKKKPESVRVRKKAIPGSKVKRGAGKLPKETKGQKSERGKFYNHIRIDEYKPPFAVGQRWKMRNGEETSVTDIDSGGCYCDDERYYISSENGKYHGLYGGSELDLTSLIGQDSKGMIFDDKGMKIGGGSDGASLIEGPVKFAVEFAGTPKTGTVSDHKFQPTPTEPPAREGGAIGRQLIWESTGSTKGFFIGDHEVSYGDFYLADKLLELKRVLTEWSRRDWLLAAILLLNLLALFAGR